MKKVILGILLIFLTGCTAKYNINITENNIKELINIKVSRSVLTNDEYKTLTSIINKPYETEYTYYDLKSKEKNGILSSTFTYTHSFDNYSLSNAVTYCYDEEGMAEEPIFSYTDDTVKISTPKEVECFKDSDNLFNPLTELKVNITTKLKVVSNNADEVDGNTYTWIINQNNYTNKPIKIEVKTEVNNSVENIKEQTGLTLAVIGIFAIPVVLLIIFIYLKGRNRNKL